MDVGLPGAVMGAVMPKAARPTARARISNRILIVGNWVWLGGEVALSGEDSWRGMSMPVILFSLLLDFACCLEVAARIQLINEDAGREECRLR